jgi:hypothetical protein
MIEYNIFQITTCQLVQVYVNRSFIQHQAEQLSTSGITSFTLRSINNGIGTGSRIQIYKLAAEKVADITVGSNTTQVDISVCRLIKTASICW